MTLNLIVLVLILLITLYLATQGLLSATLAFITATFSSILAMGLTEPLQGIVSSWRPDYARGTTFLVLFLILFSLTRVIADVVIKKNIKLPPLINRAGGGVAGFFASLVVVGTLLIGIDMLPLPRVILGFDRFASSDSVMEDSDTPGQPSRHQSGIWFAPDKLVLAIWDGASGRGLGGNRAWGDIHPDFSAESYGYRNSVAGASLRTVPPDLMTVKNAWMSREIPADLIVSDAQHKYPEPGKALVMVRSQVRRGDKPGHESADPTDSSQSYFRVTPTQVRLVTDKQHQYYPIGYLDQGRRFRPLPLDSGHIVEDYPQNNVVTEDWIFQIGDDERPVWFELKELARADISGIVREKVEGPLARSEYPQHAYLNDLSSLSVTFDTKGKTIREAYVYVLQSSVVEQDVDSQVKSAYLKVKDIDTAIGSNSGGWGAPKPGVPTSGEFRQAVSAGNQRVGSNIPSDQSVGWNDVMTVMLLGQATNDGEKNLGIYPQYFQDTVLPMWSQGSKGPLLIARAKADDKGVADLVKSVTPGNRTIVATVLTDRGFFVWILPQDIKAATKTSLTFVAGSVGGAGTPQFAIDLDAQ